MELTYSNMALRDAIAERFLDAAIEAQQNNPTFEEDAYHERDIPLPNVDSAVAIGAVVETAYGPQRVTAAAVASAHEMYDPVLTSASAVWQMRPDTPDLIIKGVEYMQTAHKFAEGLEAKVETYRKKAARPKYYQLNQWADLFSSGAPRRTVQVSEAVLDGDYLEENARKSLPPPANEK